MEMLTNTPPFPELSWIVLGSIAGQPRIAGRSSRHSPEGRIRILEVKNSANTELILNDCLPLTILNQQGGHKHAIVG
jgi:hypothetical protein